MEECIWKNKVRKILHICFHFLFRWRLFSLTIAIEGTPVLPSMSARKCDDRDSLRVAGRSLQVDMVRLDGIHLGCGRCTVPSSLLVCNFLPAGQHGLQIGLRSGARQCRPHTTTKPDSAMELIMIAKDCITGGKLTKMEAAEIGDLGVGRGERLQPAVKEGEGGGRGDQNRTGNSDFRPRGGIFSSEQKKVDS